MDDPISVASEGAAPGLVHDVWRVLLRFVVPIALVFILWNSLPETWNKIVGVFGG